MEQPSVEWGRRTTSRFCVGVRGVSSDSITKEALRVCLLVFVARSLSLSSQDDKDPREETESWNILITDSSKAITSLLLVVCSGMVVVLDRRTRTLNYEQKLTCDGCWDEEEEETSELDAKPLQRVILGLESSSWFLKTVLVVIQN